MTTPNVLAQRPTVTIGALFTAGMTALSALVAHGVISAHFAKTYGPWIVLAVLAVGFALVWFHVVPAAKAEQALAELESGRLPDADHARILAGVSDVIHEALGGIEPVPMSADQPAPTAPSMSAGAPPSA